MGWWSSVADKTTAISETIKNRGKWLWNQASTPVTSILAYGANILVYGLNQGVALRKSVPALADPESMNVVTGLYRIAESKTVPLILLNYFNTYWILHTANSFSNDEQEKTAQAEIAFLINMSLMGVYASLWAYNQRQSLELAVQKFILDFFGPAALGAHRTTSPTDPCIVNQCTLPRKIKGSIRESVTLVFHKGVAIGLNEIPYVGPQLAQGYEVISYGDYIARGAALGLGRCERHRGIDSELLITLGLSYVFLERTVENLLSQTVDIPSYFVLGTIQQLLIFALIKNATHMEIKHVPYGAGTLGKYDPIAAYQHVTSRAIDAGFKAAMALAQSDPNQEPLFPLSTVLQKTATVLNSDLETEQAPPSSLITRTMKSAVTFVFPPFFHSTQNVVHDPVARIFWPSLQEPALFIVKQVEEKGFPIAAFLNSDNLLAAQASKMAVKNALIIYLGLSKETAKFIVSLAKDKDFWILVIALKQWLIRHQISDVKELAPISKEKLNTLYEPRQTPALTPPAPAETDSLPSSGSSEFHLKSQKSTYTLSSKTAQNRYRFTSQKSTYGLQSKKIEEKDLDLHKSPFIPQT